jgi:hypothetical protein
MHRQKLSTSIFFTYHVSANFIFKPHVQKYLYLLEFLVPFSKANQYRSKNQKQSWSIIPTNANNSSLKLFEKNIYEDKI